MNSYRVFRKSDGKLVFGYFADAPTEYNFPFATHDHVLQEPEVVIQPPVTVYGGRRELTRLEFMRLFTANERIAIKDFSAGTTAPAKAVRDFMYMMELAGSVNLDDQDTVTGANFMENRGLIGAGRAVEILNG